MARNYVYSNLATRDALYLEIAGVRYEVAQYSASWAANEIPTAACMLAIGRQAHTQAAAAIHGNSTHVQMELAKVFFTPKGEYSRDEDWPEGTRVIFEGFFTGFAHRKINGKIHVIANLIHWLAALGMSSSLTSNGHVSNPTQLNAAAMLQSMNSTIGQGAYISDLAPASLVAGTLNQDLWGAIKGVFCEMANTPVMPVTFGTACGGTGNFQINTFALSALSRIEGVTPTATGLNAIDAQLVEEGAPGACSVPYVWGAPLALDVLGASIIEDAISEALGTEMIESYANMSFWDKLVGSFCPAFGMAVVPMVDSAIVIADTPVLQPAFWKQLKAEDYDAFDMTSELHRPLNAVGVMADSESPTQPSLEDPTPPVDPNNPLSVPQVPGGCYVEDSVGPGDGMTIFVRAPMWLRSLRMLPVYSGHTSGTHAQMALPTGTTPSAGGGLTPLYTPGTFGEEIGRLYERYAHTVYVNQMLRGRNGSFSGKLRFDIAPGSIVMIDGTSERFIGGEDNLGVTLFGCVQRVTTMINAEAGMAGTTFLLSHIRTANENELARTSVLEHPLFGSAIHGNGKHGSPLKDVYNLD